MDSGCLERCVFFGASSRLCRELPAGACGTETSAFCTGVHRDGAARRRAPALRCGASSACGRGIHFRRAETDKRHFQFRALVHGLHARLRGSGTHRVRAESSKAPWKPRVLVIRLPALRRRRLQCPLASFIVLISIKLRKKPASSSHSLPHVFGRLIQRVDLFERRRCGRPDANAARRVQFKMPAARKARRLRNERIADHVPVAAADALVENGKRVAHAAVRRDGNQHRRVVVDLPRVPASQTQLEALGDVLRRDTPEIKTLAAGEDRRQQLVRLRSSPE